jgi:hypothetical protein
MSGKIRFLKIISVAVIISASVIIINSCRKAGEDLFIGNWQYTGIVTADDMTYIITRNLQLTRTTYEETFEVQRQITGTISGIIGTRGNLGKSRNDVIFELKELGTCARDSIDGCTSTVLWYGDGTQYWTDNVAFFGLIIKGDVKADETYLTLTRDLNNDGDMSDEGENIIFTRI